MFIHLHNHSHYSILEWLPKPTSYVTRAKELWMKAVALTDTSNIHGCHEFYKACKAENIIPIMWSEILVEWELDKSINHKIVLLAKSLKGYQNIIALITKANLSSEKGISKIHFEDLKDHSEDVICLSWPISWEIPYYILSWKTDEEILDRIKQYQTIFWEENYFLELLYHDDIPKQRLVTDKLIEINKNHWIPVVATNNCYYLGKEDKKTQDVIVALWTWHELENPDRPTFINWDYSFLDEEEMQALFWFIPEALENTSKIADMVNMEIETGWILIPVFELPEEHQKIYEEAKELEKDEKWLQKLDSSEWYLRYLSFEWMNKRFNSGFSKDEIFELIKKLDKPSLSKQLVDTSPEELKDLSITYYTDKKNKFLKTLSEQQQGYIERLEYELVVIHEMWFDGYFLIVADYINRARQNNIPVWPWRWSAAWSLMAYLSWITDLNPLTYSLLFERFLNPARVSMPDIDTDFADTERDKVVDYCRRKYWEQYVAQICTFGTFAARAAVKDVGRVYWVPFAEMNQLASLIPEKPWTKLKWALEDSIEFKTAYETDPKYKEIIDNALKIEWNVRQIWVHACAVIIAPKPMTDFTALSHPPKDSESIITQYSAHPLEDLWLLKMDFLWLKNLTIIKRALKIIKANKGVDIDILNIDLADPKVFEIFSNWDTTWVFQFESDWMRKYLRELKPNVFEDIIVMVSLYRPWPLQYIPTYINRKYWLEQVEYAHESLEKILAPTQWIAVYQEQIMQMVQAFAGFSLWEADILRRAIWKKKIKLLMEQKKKFLIAAKNLWHDEELAKHIFEDVIEPFAWYWFNKSHAACYAFIAYQTAFLKAYYRTEFLTAIMVSDEENIERITLEVWEAESKWINILPPDINESMKHFTYIDDNNIRFWLKAIKWLWDWPIESIMRWRQEKKYSTLKWFIKRWWKEVVNKKSLEALIMSWAMDILWDRKELLENIPEITRFLKAQEKKESSNQIWLFDLWWWWEWFDDDIHLKKVEPFKYEEKLFLEKEVLGFMVSGHPLDWLKRYCARRSRNTKFLKMSFEELKQLESEDKEKFEKEVQKLKPSVVWMIVDVRKVVTKNGKNMMFLTCESFDYDFEITIFDKDYPKYKEKVEIWKMVILSWTLRINLEYARKSLYLDFVKWGKESLVVTTIAQVREQARYMELLDNSKRKIINTSTWEEDDDEEDSTENNCEENSCSDSESKEYKSVTKENDFVKEKNNIAYNEESIKKYIVTIPQNAKKQNLVDLKAFLSSQTPWTIWVYISLKWQEIDTKFSLSSIEGVKKWEKEKWW